MVTPLKRLFCAFVAAFWLVSAGAAGEWPTEGGNDGVDVVVDTLADSGSGSLRAALSQKGPRRIVFTVGGEIILKSPLVVRNPFVTIAGETAPSPGISLLGDKLRIRTHDVVVRDIRLRVGELPGANVSNRDGISIDRGGDYEVGNILIDRCSIAWAVDEGLAIWGAGISNVRVRNTIVAETLSRSVHEKGAHSMGLIVGRGVKDVVIEGNLFAHNMFRNPLIDAGASAVVINNLIYNPGWSGFHVYAKEGVGPTIVSVVGNSLIAGPNAQPERRFSSFGKGINRGSQVYYRDNLAVGREAFSTEERSGGDDPGPVPFVNSPPIWFDWIAAIPASDVEARVLAEVGARPGDRDETDARIISEVRSRTGAIKDSPVDKRLRAENSTRADED